MGDAPVRVLLVAKHNIVSEGIRLLLLERLGVAVVGVTADGAEAIAWLEARVDGVDVILADLTGDHRAARLISIVRSAQAAVHIVALKISSHNERLGELLDLPADGYLSTCDSVSSMFEAIDTVMRGERFVSPHIGCAMVCIGEREQEALHCTARLSVREHEILGLVAEGLTSKEIATRLGRSPKTVANHRTRILEKLNANSSAEAIARLHSAR